MARFLELHVTNAQRTVDKIRLKEYNFNSAYKTNCILLAKQSKDCDAKLEGL